jgi:hypothetical protein
MRIPCLLASSAAALVLQSDLLRQKLKSITYWFYFIIKIADNFIASSNDVPCEETIPGLMLVKHFATL